MKKAQTGTAVKKTVTPKTAAPKTTPKKAKGMQRAFKYNPPLKVETASAQNGKSVKKTPVKNSRINTALPGMGLPPAIPKKVETASAKHGAKMNMKKAKSGLGMKSVKSGYDDNSDVTRADFVAIGKGTAKSGTKMKKAMSGYGGKAASMAPMKSGGKMKKCKYGCK